MECSHATTDDEGERIYLSGFGKLPLIRQAAGAECALACLAMILAFYNYKIDISELRRRFFMSMRGADLSTISEIGSKLGLGSRPLRLEVDELSRLRLPAILHWEFNHFVVLKSVSKKRIVVHDPARGVLSVRLKEVAEKFTGVALELTPTQAFKRRSPSPGLTLSGLVRFDRPIVSSLSLGILLSLVAELFVLASPFYMQIIIDEALTKGDVSLIGFLTMAFAILLVFETITSVVRGLTFQYLGNLLSFDIASRVFSRLLALPANYFSNRQLGDIQHRFQGMEQVKAFFVSTAPMILIDGLLGILVLGIMSLYSYKLVLLVLAVTLVYIAWRIATFRLMRRAAGDLIVAQAETQTFLLESLRAMSTLKLMAIESRRESGWRNCNARRLNAQIRVGNLDIANLTFERLLFQGLRIAIIFMAAGMAVDNELSVGMIIAFVAYFSMYSQRIPALVQQIVAMKLLSVPLNRIADIVLERPEEIGEAGGRDPTLRGSVALQNATFRYGRAEKFILQRACFSAAVGEFVAIVGPTGEGKTTILGLLSCLIEPKGGEVLFDGRPVSNWDLSSIRRQIGVVQQDDTLLRGSIAENVALFDEAIDMPWLRECCEIACVADDINAMPMGYESLVGDMGSSFSGGQKQRILLARALYRRPKVLLLDEATSHLDTETEKAVLANLRNLAITKISVAHRATTIMAADKVFLLRNGSLSQVDPHDYVARPAREKRGSAAVRTTAES